jgi:putative membrane protein
MRFLYWVILPLFAVLLAVFAVSNREAVDIGLWPLVHVIELPLYLIVILALVVGFLVGEVAAWVAGRRWRREVRRRGRRIEELERELAATQARLDDGAAPPPVPLPARS